MQYPYVTGDNGETVEEIIEGLINNGATGMEILNALLRSTSQNDLREILDSFDLPVD
jgi:hypothetical protein